MKWLPPILNFAAAAFAFLGAWYWLKSSRTKLPAFNPATGRPTGPIDMLSLNNAIVDAGYLNKTAAIYTALSALLAGVGVAVSAVLDLLK